MNRTVAVLGYHKIGPPPPGSWKTWYAIPLDVFLEQLHTLEQCGWNVIDAATFVAGLDDPALLPPRATLITFDDAYRMLLGAARECLTGRGYPSVVFAPTALIGGRSQWDEGTEQPVEDLCNWDELRALERSGMSVQSHGVSHRAFSDLSPSQIERELVDSKAMLERRLEKPIELFAYSYGDAGQDQAVVDAAAALAGYRGAFLYDGHPMALPARERYRLERIPMGPDTHLEAELGALAT